MKLQNSEGGGLHTTKYTPRVSAPLSSRIVTKEAGPIINESSNTAVALKTKDQLVEKIKEWVKIDNEIRILQKEQTKRRLDKKKVSTELLEVMKTNGIDAFDINDGQIIYDKRNTKKPINKTTLMNLLSTYFKGDVLKASEVNNYILDNRENVVKERIVRKITAVSNDK